MAFVCRLTKTHARFIALLSNFLNNLRAEQAPENADYYGVEKSKELHFMFPLQRHFKSLLSAQKNCSGCMGQQHLSSSQNKGKIIGFR